MGKRFGRALLVADLRIRKSRLDDLALAVTVSLVLGKKIVVISSETTCNFFAEFFPIRSYQLWLSFDAVVLCIFMHA